MNRENPIMDGILHYLEEDEEYLYQMVRNHKKRKYGTISINGEEKVDFFRVPKSYFCRKCYTNKHRNPRWDPNSYCVRCMTTRMCEDCDRWTCNMCDKVFCRECVEFWSDVRYSVCKPCHGKIDRMGMSEEELHEEFEEKVRMDKSKYKSVSLKNKR